MNAKEGTIRKNKTDEQVRKQKFSGKSVFQTIQSTSRTEYSSDDNKGINLFICPSVCVVLRNSTTVPSCGHLP